jgi:hypothetical protein
VCAPSDAQRRWWQEKLGATEVVPLPTDADECKARIMADPARAAACATLCDAVDDWFAVESGFKSVKLKRGADVTGVPRDPIHPWNVKQT